MEDTSTSMHLLPNTIYSNLLSDEVPADRFITKERAEKLFIFFNEHPLFRWQGSHNDCEDRANALCILLDKWQVPNYKGWVFAGNYLTKKQGRLINNWKYHVAAVVPVKNGNELEFFVIDPATLKAPDTIFNWATNSTEIPFSYYLIKWNRFYIFHHEKIKRDNWFETDRQNYKWTIQGLAGINGVTKTGKAQLTFNKKKIEKTEKLFKNLLANKPSFLL